MNNTDNPRELAINGGPPETQISFPQIVNQPISFVSYVLPPTLNQIFNIPVSDFVPNKRMVFPASSATGTVNICMPTLAAIDTAWPGVFPVGAQWQIIFVNNSGVTGTNFRIYGNDGFATMRLSFVGPYNPGSGTPRDNEWGVLLSTPASLIIQFYRTATTSGLSQVIATTNTNLF